ncbi:MAG: phosphoribosylanthranilate isomerase [Clostridium sp.]|nr:phosphoribosylanthranilate isomerase [Clostridium sp.]
MTKIKICGLKSEQDISYVNELKPDFIGFVFLKGRKRYVSPEKAAFLSSLLEPSIQRVGVFVNEPVENVAALLQSGSIQLAQLHGQEDAEYARELKQLCSNLCPSPCPPIIKAFVIKTAKDIKKALDYPCDYLLLDGGLGFGQTFDWSLVQNINKPFFLAGGLTPENVKEAISQTHPYGVDTSSGVETDFCKDYRKMKDFIDAVRGSI